MQFGSLQSSEVLRQASSFQKSHVSRDRRGAACGQDRRAGLAINLYPGLIYLLAFLVAKRAPGVSLMIYAGMPLLYFLSITVLRGSRQRNREYADFT